MSKLWRYSIFNISICLMNIKHHWLVACFTVLLQLSENYLKIIQFASQWRVTSSQQWLGVAASTSRSEVSLWSTQYRYNLSVGHYKGSGVFIFSLKRNNLNHQYSVLLNSYVTVFNLDLSQVPPPKPQCKSSYREVEVNNMVCWLYNGVRSRNLHTLSQPHNLYTT